MVISIGSMLAQQSIDTGTGKTGNGTGLFHIASRQCRQFLQITFFHAYQHGISALFEGFKIWLELPQIAARIGEGLLCIINPHLFWQMSNKERGLIKGHHQALFDGVDQFADVAGPGMFLKRFEKLGRESPPVNTVMLAKSVHEEIEQGRDVFRTLPERRQRHGQGSDPIEKIAAKQAFFDHFIEVFVGSSNQSEITAYFGPVSQWTKTSFLKNPEKFLLHRQWQLTDLIEKQGAAIGLLDKTFPWCIGAGKGALFMPEENALQQGNRQRGTIYRYHRLFFSGAVLVNCPGEKLLACPCFPGNQDVQFAPGRPGDQVETGDHFSTAANNICFVYMIGLITPFCLPVIEGANEGKREAAELGSLFDITPGAVFDCQFSATGIAESRNDDNFRIVRRHLERRYNVEPIAIR